MINEIETLNKQIEQAYKTKDVIDLQKDIDEGLSLIKNGLDISKGIYIDKIESKYSVYIIALNIAMNIRKNNNGATSTRNLVSLDETITQYIRVLDLVKTEKLYEEIKKVIDYKENVFVGGVIGE